MKTVMKCFTLLALMLAAVHLEAANNATHPLPPGMGRYILVLRVVDERPDTPKTITEPDVAKLGGTVLSKHDNRRVIDLPPAAAKNLRADKNVAYVQRVWMGEPLDTWDERDDPSGATLKAHTDDTAGTNLTWSSGAFQYDPSDNIKAIGSDTYAYDTANRLVKAVVNGQTETYGYDSFGNLTQKTLAGQNPTIPPIDPSSNRIIGVTYDAAGNVTSNGSTITYEFDSVGAMSGMVTNQGDRRRFLYTADDERIGRELPTIVRWTIRDFNTGKVLREFQDDGLVGGGAWEWTEDYVYAGGTLVGAETEQFWGGKRHFHLDHLGSVRMITNDAHKRYSRNDFLPFGAEQSSSVQEATNYGYWRSDPMKYTGHEREFYGAGNVDNSDYLDYMHARYYNPNMGRFLSVDPGKDRDPHKPQSWNGYVYVRNNPINTVDPTGKWGWGDFKDWVRETREGVSNWWHETWHKDIPAPADQYDAVAAGEAADLSPTDARQIGNPQAQWANARAEAGAIVSDQATEEVMSWGVGKAVGMAGVVVFGHGARHLIGTALEKEAVEEAIEKEIQFVSKEASQSGSFWGRVTVNGQVIEYRAFTLPDGTINVGTYYTPKP